MHDLESSTERFMKTDSPHGTEETTPAMEENIRQLVAIFAAGVTECACKVGIELEHTIVHADDLSPISYEEEHGAHWILEQLAPAYDEQEFDSAGNLIALARPGETVTLEPGEQVEISAGPFAHLQDAAKCLQDFERRLNAVAAQGGLRVSTLGYHPSARVLDMNASPKRRYELLAAHLDSVGDFGRRMMYGTASTQVSIDYTDEADCMRKMRLASIASPLLALMTDNTPFFEGAPRPHALMRTEIWNECDRARCATIPGVCSPDFSWRSYAQYVLGVPAIMVHDDEAPGGFAGTELAPCEIFRDKPMERRDVDLALSLVFPDVRLKSYVEIRPADALPIPYVIAYAALTKGLFATRKSLDALDALFGEANEADIAQAKIALMAEGYQAAVYGTRARALCDELISIAKAGLCESERPFLEPLAELVARRTTLADMSQQR